MALRLSDDQAKALGIAEHIPKRVKRTITDEFGRNKTEARYARRLDDMKHAGAIREHWFERVKFRLANRCWFTPDFLIEYRDGSKAFHEVKGGFIREDGWIKLKVAADAMPFPFYLAQWSGKEWEITVIPSGRAVQAIDGRDRGTSYLNR